MLTSSSNLPQNSLKLNQDDKKVFSKRLARDFTVSNLNTEDYHVGASVAVPFTWESQPGTPKIMFRENPLPPLTPPPSYSYKNPKRAAKKFSKSNILDSIFPKLSPSWSAKCSVPSSPARVPKSRGSYHGISSSSRRYIDSRKTMLDHLDDQDRDNECESPVSTLCFGFGRGGSAGSRVMKSILKLVLMIIIGIVEFLD
ncbi:Aspartate aminotransferase [Salix suchowensis]|nr:Aspartate aminotransferase [Salix suchowensis]